MTSLTDVYEGTAGNAASRRQQLLGRGLFVVGTSMLVGAIAVATTGTGYEALGETAARQLGGVLAGVGLPTVLLGVFAVLPASHRVRAAAVIGASVSVLGVGLFRYAYPENWVEGAPVLALATTTVYFFGVATVLWGLFVALATFKTRSDPGGSARMEITEEGTIRLVEEARSGGGLGGIGMFGADPDGSVETQTNRPADAATPDASVGSAAVSDGGAAADAIQTPSGSSRSNAGEASGAQSGRSDPSSEAGAGGELRGDGVSADTGLDAYCGNCRHFEYVEDPDGPQPYCNFHNRRLDDMDACSAWVDQS